MAETRAIDIIVQAATVELFRSYDIAVAPLAARAVSLDLPTDPSRGIGSLEFSSEHFTGRLSLSLTMDLAQATSTGQGGRAASVHADWVSELTNQLMSRIKNRLSRFGVQLRPGLPITRLGAVPPIPTLASAETLTFAFRTLKGDVYVILTGKFNHGAIKYCGVAQPEDAPDLIMF